MAVKIFKWVLLAAVLIQLIPFGRSHLNPPKIKEPSWNSPDTRALFRRACFDCHSNETVWPWYSNVAAHILASPERREWRPQPLEFHRVGSPPAARQRRRRGGESRGHAAVVLPSHAPGRQTHRRRKAGARRWRREVPGAAGSTGKAIAAFRQFAPGLGGINRQPRRILSINPVGNSS